VCAHAGHRGWHDAVGKCILTEKPEGLKQPTLAPRRRLENASVDCVFNELL